MTARRTLWEEEFAIVVGSDGRIRGEDVRRMTPERRAWTLRRIREFNAAVARARKGRST